MGVSEAFKRVELWSESFAFTWSWGCYLCPAKGSAPFVRGAIHLFAFVLSVSGRTSGRQENSPINVV